MNVSLSKLSQRQQLATKVSTLLQKRAKLAQERLAERVRKVYDESKKELFSKPVMPWDIWTGGTRYATDFAQRTVLFWDTLRQRGNQFIERERAGLPPVLHYDYESVLEGSTLARPVNYELVRIVPPKGVKIDAKKRPYLIIDPRAGHGPGIGGFKDDSQVGVALREGHPVYFVLFRQEPEPGQTLLDVCEAERQFVRRVRELHPGAPKPALVGNCQGGWAAMMLAAASPDDTGPIVINGAPMSYWGGAFNEDEGDNPMRYSGGMLGGTWLASLFSDLGAGKFDGAWLVQNFENLNPANTFWDKYYHVFANIDTEPPRFLDFERWWGGFYLMNREEIEWITQNLFVGNKVWKSATGTTGKMFDLREIRQPIVLFASMGDNITPPQQAFNWVADLYGSTDEIKARGQVIVGLLHETIGHLGIFVSGKVATKEHAQIVEVLKSIEALPPGLYGMKIAETKARDGKVGYEVSFIERQLEEITVRLNRFERKDEEPFEAVARVSEFNQRAYELFAQPIVQAMSNDTSAKLGRRMHPVRLEQEIASDRNPWLAWVAPMAAAVKAARQPAPADSPLKAAERAGSEFISASLDYYRDVRDALSEAQFFATFGILFPALHPGGKEEAGPAAARAEGRELPVVRDALAAIDEGGYAEALARAACLLARKGEPFPLARIELKAQIARDYRDLLPALESDEWHRIRGRQEIICRYEPEQALATLPTLLASADDRERFLMVLDQLLTDPRIPADRVSAKQRTMAARIHEHIEVAPASRKPRLTVVPKKTARRA